MNTSTIETRKLNYILKEANISLNQIDERFQKIDNLMSKINIGTKVYIRNCFGDIFEKTVIEIVDEENGMIRVLEQNVGNDIYCVLDVDFSISECEDDWSNYHE